MAELNKNYKCNVCGNLVKVLEAGVGTLICCNQPMLVVEETTTPEAPKETPISSGIETPSEPQVTSEPEEPPIPETPPEEKSSPSQQ